MLSYIIRRLIYAALLVLGAAMLVFVLINIAPGDPVVALAGEDGDSGYYAAMREKFGLNKPLAERLWVFVGNVLRGDLGYSWRYGRPASEVILAQLPSTLLLVVPALLLAIAIGLGLGTLAAAKAGKLSDFAVTVLALLGSAVPGFWLAQLAVLLFAYYLNWLPVQGMIDVRARHTGMAYVLDVAQHMIMPVSILALQFLAPIARITRVGVIEALHQPYTQTARAKGLSERLVLLRHALTNASLPIITLVGEQVGFMFTGAVLVENVFAWPGLGRLMLSAMLARDLGLITAMFMVISVSVVLANLVTDILYGYADPRVNVKRIGG